MAAMDGATVIMMDGKVGDGFFVDVLSCSCSLCGGVCGRACQLKVPERILFGEVVGANKQD